MWERSVIANAAYTFLKINRREDAPPTAINKHHSHHHLWEARPAAMLLSYQIVKLKAITRLERRLKEHGAV